MREYRGKTKGGEWVYGDKVTRVLFDPYEREVVCIYKKKYVKNGVTSFNTFIEVLPESVGQFAGLKDQKGKGKKVYDDDYCLIRVDFNSPDAKKSNCKNIKVLIYYDDELYAWCWHERSQYGGHTARFDEYEFDVIEVIGNKTDSPTLLESPK